MADGTWAVARTRYPRGLSDTESDAARAAAPDLMGYLEEGWEPVAVVSDGDGDFIYLRIDL